MKKMIKTIFMLAVVATLFTSCSKDSDIPAGKGEVKTSITDGPFPFNIVKEANIDVTKIEVKTTSGEYVVLYDGSVTYNLVGLTNGITADVKTTNIDPGTYTEARITTTSASISFEGGNSFTASANGDPYVVQIEPALVVEDGESTEILIDIDLGKSFSFFGFGGFQMPDWFNSPFLVNSCTYHPHIRVCNFGKTGKITGNVTLNNTEYENANVYFTINGETVSTHTKADGSFTFIGVTEGNYTVHCKTKDGHHKVLHDIHLSGTDTAICIFDIP